MREMTPEMMQQLQNMRGNMPPGEGGRNMDTAAMRRFMQMRGNRPQDGQRDSTMIRRFQNQGGPPPGGQQN